MLVEYLPEFMREFKEIKAVAQTEDVEISRVDGEVDVCLDNTFVSSANDNGLRRWEGIFGITPKGGDSIEGRRLAVLARIAGYPPYTLAALKRDLLTLCNLNGKGEYTIEVDCADFTVTVRLGLSEQEAIPSAMLLLQKYVPANMVVDLDLLYNTYGVLKGRRHYELGEHTHEFLRKGVFE